MGAPGSGPCSDGSSQAAAASTPCVSNTHLGRTGRRQPHALSTLAHARTQNGHAHEPAPPQRTCSSRYPAKYSSPFWRPSTAQTPAPKATAAATASAALSARSSTAGSVTSSSSRDLRASRSAVASTTVPPLPPPAPAPSSRLACASSGRAAARRCCRRRWRRGGAGLLLPAGAQPAAAAARCAACRRCRGWSVAAGSRAYEVEAGRWRRAAASVAVEHGVANVSRPGTMAPFKIWAYADAGQQWATADWTERNRPVPSKWRGGSSRFEVPTGANIEQKRMRINDLRCADSAGLVMSPGPATADGRTSSCTVHKPNTLPRIQQPYPKFHLVRSHRSESHKGQNTRRTPGAWRPMSGQASGSNKW